MVGQSSDRLAQREIIASQRAAPTVKDDFALLDLMLADMERQQERWQPTNYWRGYCQRISSELRRVGIRHFRSNWDLIKGYGSIRPLLRPVFPRQGLRGRIMNSLIRLPLARRIDRQYRRELERANEEAGQNYQLNEALTALALQKGAVAGPILEKVTERLAGYDPGDQAVVGQYTQNFLHQVVLWSLLAQVLDLNQVDRVLEIGGGYGALCEVSQQVRLGSNGYFVEVDIPPMSYISTQYLKSLYPGNVLDYRDALEMGTITSADLKGKILVIPPWLLERLDVELDLFWNSASFQEMEKPIVQGYLDWICNRTSAIFLSSLRDGHKSGAGAQIEPISFGWITEQISDRGFIQAPLDETTIEWKLFETLLPGYDAGVFRAG